jgi:hypothetical protein
MLAPHLLLLTAVTGCLSISAAALAQPGESGQGIGYPSVAAALAALKARSDVNISVKEGWTIVNDPAEKALWSFTPSNHPAHPAAVKRATVERDGQVFINMRALCQAEKSACDKLIAEFQELNQKVIADVQRQATPSNSQWSASEQQKSRALETLTRFLRAADESRHGDAYDMFTPGMKAMMTFEQFVAHEVKFQAQSGGEPARTETRATWYKDPPKAAAPGVYAAFNIRCSFREINVCEEVVILHEQSNGEFLVMRQERNFIDKENERKIRNSRDQRESM